MDKARFRGCLLGLAVGDAVGTTVEFSPPGTFPPVTDMTGGGPFHLQAGQWTDDTSMALCLAESLLAKQAFDPADQMERYLRWYREGYLSSTGRCFDIGATVRDALNRFARNPQQPYAGSTDPYSAGNGSLMRLAPVPLFFSADDEKAIELSGDSSKTTHGAVACIDACRYFASLLLDALRGVDRRELFSGSRIPANLSPDIAEIAAGSFLRKNPPAIQGTGYVVRSLEAALWAFATTSNFREGCLRAANLGDDADTTCAIYGQLAGAYYGDHGIPREWRERLHLRSYIETIADRLMPDADRG